MKDHRNLRKIKLALLLCAVFLAALLAGRRKAEAATYKVSFGNASCTVGDSVKVTLSVSPEAASIEMKLAYSSDYLQMTGYSGGLGNASISYNTSSISINDYASNGAKTATYTFTFKSKAVGSGWVKVSEVVEITNAAGDPQPSSVANQAAVTIKQKPTASSEAHLSSLTIVPGKWNKSFDPNVTEYTINLSEYTSELTFQFKTKDSNTTVGYWPYTKPGKIALTDTTINFYIKCTAQDGKTVVTYHFVITRPPKPTVAPTQPPTTEAPTVAPTKPTEEPTQPPETSPEETTPEETTEPVPKIEIPAQVLEIMAFPEGFEVPEGYEAKRMMDREGTVFDALVPVEGDSDHYLVYGSKDGEEPDLYAFFEEEKLLRPYSLMIPETTEEPTTEEPTTEEPTTEEPTTEEETTTEAVTPEETQAPTTEPYRVNFLDGDTKVPGWVTTVAAALLAICLLTILLLALARHRDRKAADFAEKARAPLSPEEEKEFLSLSGNSLQPARPGSAAPETAGAESPEALSEEKKEIHIPL